MSSDLLAIHLNQSCYFAGDTATGQVWLNLFKPKSLTKAAVELRFDGEIVTRKTVQSGDSYQTKTDRTQPPSRNFSVTVIDSKEPKYFDVGMHKFLFQFQIPAGIPGSIVYAYGVTRSTCGKPKYEINYWMGAELMMRGAREVKCMSICAPESTLHTRRGMTILEKTSLQEFHSRFRVPCSLGRTLSYTTTRNCINTVKQKIPYLVQMEKMHYAPGEPIKIFIQLDNGTDKTLKNIDIDLFQISRYEIDHRSSPDLKDVKVKEDQVAQKHQLIEILPGKTGKLNVTVSNSLRNPVTTSLIHPRKIKISYRLLILLKNRTQTLVDTEILLIHTDQIR